ncbi:MAG: penicillin-binding protein 2 [Cyanobacteria bacterium Co-bin13]|nr:penicillin-binding protein 2 [Cyanobacteria bacterium Co-bin13]
MASSADSPFLKKPLLRKQLKKQPLWGKRLRRHRHPNKQRQTQRQGRGQGPRSPVKSHQPTRLRALIVWGLLMLGIVALGVRLAHLQLVQGPTLTQIARQQQFTPDVPRPARRPIVDREGNVLAVDRIIYTLYAHPQLFQKAPAEVAEGLSPLLEIPQDELLNRFSQQKSGIQLSLDLSQEAAERVRNLRLDGLELLPQQQRFYPQQSLFAPIVGFVNVEGVPQAGLESAFEKELLMEAAAAAAVPAAPLAAGSLNPTVPPELAAPLKLQLTLDSRLQRVAQQELQATVDRHGAKRGTVMVMDAQTGALLALATSPTYDPNRYYESDITTFRNWAVSDLYEPGSTFKPINIAIALEVGAITPDDGIYDEGRLQFGEWTIQNSDFSHVGGRGPLSITDVLKYSSNVGMVHIMDRVRSATYFDWLQRLGLGRSTGVDLPSEVVGQLKDRDQFVNSDVESATASFGQGFALTPMQLLQLQAILANGGKLVTPHVVQGLVDDKGSLRWQPDRPTPQPVFSPETTQAVLEMMEAVVSDGTGKPAQLPGYRVGGKTGTAQKVTEAGVYGNGRITSFVSILPIEAPRYVVLAVIDEPFGDNAYGSTVAAPLVKSVMESLVVIQRIPPAQAAAQ